MKALIAKKALDAVRNEKTRKHLAHAVILIFSVLLTPSLLFFAFLDSAFSSFSSSGEEYVSTFDQIEDFSGLELEENEANACSFLLFTFPDCFKEDTEVRIKEIAEIIRDGGNAVTVLNKLTEYSFLIYDDMDIAVLTDILGGK